ncbi:MAG: ATP-binding protein [candidate division Zixibacteria bacterium]|nr:ATP-binding protein [candidate division Zixibacteria bacterium]
MAFRNFRLVCTIRAVFLAATMAAIVYLLLRTELVATAVIAGALAVFQVWALVHYVDKSNRDLGRFLLSVRYSDFTSSFPSDGMGGSHRELREAFESVLAEFRKTRSDKQEQYRYLQTVVQHVGIGLLAYDSTGKIDLLNNTAKRLLGISGARSINDLSLVSQELVPKLQSLTTGQRELHRIELPGETLQLVLSATEFKLGQRSVKLVSLTNISSELAEREMEAWQQLVRILTHEIMNSITPIASLATTSRQIVESGELPGNTSQDDLHSAITTIEKRSKGLLHFVDAYRTLTRIPKPEYRVIRVDELLKRITQLTTSRPEAGTVTLSSRCDPPTLELTADPDLVEQVLINLTTNSLQALAGRIDGRIELTSHLNERGRVLIDVKDNGPGISPEALDAVFVPFYTTRKDGTGIGLSLSRQIMRLHKGDITAASRVGEGVTFTLRF